MLPHGPLQALPQGKLAENTLHFARLLRSAGLQVGTDRALLTLQALRVAGIGSRAELHDVLQACLISRAEHRALFDEAFRLFWSEPDALGDSLRRLLPASGAGGKPPNSGSRRVLDALLPPRTPLSRTIELTAQADASGEGGWSDREQLRKRDFESMSTAEYLAAQRCVAALEPLLAQIRTRRASYRARGPRPDLRRLLRQGGRYGGDVIELPRRVPRTRTEPLCVIVDISGSMARYSRMFLHFMHALMNTTADLRVSAFVFATRLSHITRELARRDADEAVDRVVRYVEDWSGGTRIGSCLREFNQRWVRRLPLASATVLLVTDGLELAHTELLASEAQRLARSCRRILWLNPLLRYRGFEPKARGVRALLPHVERLLPVHNVESLEQLLLALRSNTVGAPRYSSRPWSRSPAAKAVGT